MPLSSSRPTVAAAPTPARTVEPPAAGCETPDPAPLPAPSQLGNFGDAFLLDEGEFSQIVAPGDVSETVAYGVNNHGQVVGGYVDRQRSGQGYLLEKGVFKDLDAPGVKATIPFNINNHGQIVGAFSEVTDMSPVKPPFRSFLLDKGVYTIIDYPGAESTVAFDINERGQVVGTYGDSTAQHGFIWENGSFKTVDIPGALATALLGINSRGQIVGGYIDPAYPLPRGFLPDEGVCTVIEPPGAQITQPEDINDSGRVIGIYQDGSGVIRGFLQDKGTFTTIEAPGASPHTAVFGLNDKGQIVGFRQQPDSSVSSPAALVSSGGGMLAR